MRTRFNLRVLQYFLQLSILALLIPIICASTIHYISSKNYPVEPHNIKTEDGYTLQLFRIPSSPEFVPTNQTSSKPVVLLVHGFALTSDAWVLSDPAQNLAFLLADAGCDVWLANQRGNIYSRQHEFLEGDKRAFWNFSLHELGYYDLAAIFDYILLTTSATRLHYVGYSQGTSALLVLLSMRPIYSMKVKSVHLLAPIVFMQNMRQPLAKLASWFENVGATLASWFGYREVLRHTSWPYYQEACELLCGEENGLNFLCSGLFNSLVAWSLLPAICATHPAGVSTKQILHFLQIYKTGQFQQYDYGSEQNEEIYGQSRPPVYEIHMVQNCMNLYYSSNDYLSAAADVEQLSRVLPCAKLKRIEHDDWNHYDFLWSHNIKEAVCDTIIDEIKSYEEN